MSLSRGLHGWLGRMVSPGALRIVLGFGVVGATSLGAPVVAFAQPSEEPSLADKETARELFREGDEKFREGDYEAALKAFAAADDIMGVPTTGVERARSLMKLGRLLEATELLQRIMRAPESPDENEVQRTAREEAASMLDEVRERIPSLRVVVEGNEGVDVKLVVDDVEVPSSAQDFPRKVDPGEHRIRVAAVGFRPEEKTVQVEEGQQQTLRVTLQPVDSDAPVVDPWETTTESAEGSGGGIDAYQVMMWSGYGVAAAGLIAGTITGAMSLAKTAELEGEDKCGGVQCPPDLIQERDDFLPIAHASTASFVIAGVGAAVGTVGLVLSLRSDGGEERASLSPWVGPGSAGLRGTF